MRKLRIALLLLPSCAGKFAPSSREELSKAIQSWVDNPSHASHMFGNISHWDVSRITSMSTLFDDNAAFNEDLSAWDVSSVTDMSFMFYSCTAFNSNLSEWDVSRVSDMTKMFGSAVNFNGDVSTWDVSKVTSTVSMFESAHKFHGNLSKWNVSNVVSMGSMFADATSFNSDLSKWDVSKVTKMDYMFSGAKSFNADLTKWDVSAVARRYQMFQGVNYTLCDHVPDSLTESCRDECTPPECNEASTKDTCDAHGNCKWCVSKDQVHKICFYKRAAPESGWTCEGSGAALGGAAEMSPSVVV